MRRRVDESMSLLAGIMNRPLDGGYAEAAARKAARPADVSAQPPAGRPFGRWLAVAAVALVLGLTVTLGVRALRAPSQADQRARAALERSAEQASERLAALRQRYNKLSGEVAALEIQALARRDPSAAARAQELAAAVGALAVAGAGLKISIAPDPQALADDDPDALIRSGDLRLLVGALRQAGAEAVAVGGVRLTATTAIRDVGNQIQVGFEPLPALIVIEAIGPAADMELGLAEGRAGDRISLLRGYLKATVSIDRADRLELPASPDVAGLEYAAAEAEKG
ncbi:MAG: DUF881 domain-containing protein [Bifidobacteriaceae bacterium]|jgi:uncharacterized protein YlxW (UPF0749 family)|nr:DUF881 domain-containing protein [Bifidobacteriaceae bacterium]